MVKVPNWDAPSKIPRSKIKTPTRSEESDSILKRLEEFFGYNHTYIHWVGTYCKELEDVPFFLSLTKEGIAKLEEFLDKKLKEK
jgi:hypothetical protein